MLEIFLTSFCNILCYVRINFLMGSQFDKTSRCAYCISWMFHIPVVKPGSKGRGGGGGSLWKKM